MIGELDLVKREHQSILQVLKIHLTRSIKELQTVEDELAEQQKSFWIKDLPIQGMLSDYRKEVSNILTIYTQMEEAFNTYNEELLTYMKSFDEKGIKEELEGLYKEDLEKMQDSAEQLQRKLKESNKELETWQETANHYKEQAAKYKDLYGKVKIV